MELDCDIYYTYGGNETVHMGANLGIYWVPRPLVQRSLGHCRDCRSEAHCPAIFETRPK